MQKGFIVWNETNYGQGFEFFGVYRTYDRAFKQLKKIIKAREGIVVKTPDDLDDFYLENNDYENSYRITYFSETEI